MKIQAPHHPIGVMGYSLVELMTALVIGMVLMAGVSTVFISNKKAYTTNDGLARLQENGRIALQIMSRDIRSAGYSGCSNSLTSVNNQLNNPNDFKVNNDIAIEAVEFGASVAGATWEPSGSAVSLNPVPLPNTDALVLRFADVSQKFDLTSDMNGNSATIKLSTSTTGISTGDILMLTDCSSAEIFQVTDYKDNLNNFDQLIHNPGNCSPYSPCNATQKFSKAYNNGGKIMKFVTKIYYIGTGASGEPALYRATLSKGILDGVELVDGIENIQIMFGKDVSNDSVPDVYLNATDVTNNKTALADKTAEWINVKSVRVAILARSQANLETSANKAGGQALDSASYDLDEDGVAEYDASTDASNLNRMYQRRIFRTTLLMRNL